MDDKRRIAMVETRLTDSPTTGPRWRFQLGNLLGSSVMELESAGRVISYEEYHPYGSTAFQSSGSTEVSPKRYRYTGKEKDEETGLCYHGARYYVPWLGRWTAADPAGVVDGLNLYAYGRNRPVNLSDPSGTRSSQSDEEQSSTGRMNAPSAAPGRPEKDLTDLSGANWQLVKEAPTDLVLKVEHKLAEGLPENTATVVDGSLILNDRGLGLRYLPLSEVPKNQASQYGEYLFYKDAERFEAVHTLSEDAEHYRFHGSTDPDAAAAAAVEVNARVKTHWA